jgi:SAM-dependent methyltransferase
MQTGNISCWLCKNHDVQLLKPGVDKSALEVQSFAVTDSHYGKTLAVYCCRDCGFRFCPDADDVLPYYQKLEDSEYERTRSQRSLQAKKLLDVVKRYIRFGTLLDVGAGSGILVEQAIKTGFEAQGVEPAAWFVEQARKRNLPVIEGTLSSPAIAGNKDVITVVDVLEHVSNPLQLLSDVRQKLSSSGIAVIVTPDAGSLMARCMGYKWWHYRIAHVSYWDRKTLENALQRSGLVAVAWLRPSWYFPLDYLIARLGEYLPFLKPISKVAFTRRITIPLNLGDSWMVIARKSS